MLFSLIRAPRHKDWHMVLPRLGGWGKGDDVLLGISKQRRATKRKVAMLEKSLPWRLRSILSPMTAAYYVTPRQYVDQHMAPRPMQIAPREHVKADAKDQAHLRSG